MRFAALILISLAGLGCASSSEPELPPVQPEKADISILFVGNSHTGSHNLSGLVGEMIQHRFPEKTVSTRIITGTFLDTIAAVERHRKSIGSGDWDFVVLQGQKISTSGKYDYSTAEGIELAKLAREAGSDVIFYSEWGLQGQAGHAERQEKIYVAMAEESKARVARVGAAWDFALAEDPELPLYSGDGNHQSELGAFLTASVLFAAITGEDPKVVADFPYPDTDQLVRVLLTKAASQATRNQPV